MVERACVGKGLGGRSAVRSQARTRLWRECAQWRSEVGASECFQMSREARVWAAPQLDGGNRRMNSGREYRDKHRGPLIRRIQARLQALQVGCKVADHRVLECGVDERTNRASSRFVRRGGRQLYGVHRLVVSSGEDVRAIGIRRVSTRKTC